jgi:hypothetical protein
LDDMKRLCHSWSGEWEGAVWWEPVGPDLQRRCSWFWGRCGCVVLTEGRCDVGWWMVLGWC